MTLTTRNRIENLKGGEILMSDSRDAILIVSNRAGFCIVKDFEFSEEEQEFVPQDEEYYLTYNEIAHHFDI